MSFIEDVQKSWKIVITSKDLYLENPSKEELLDLITASLPYREITSQIVRLAVHVIKIQIYSKSTTSWEQTIISAVADIKNLNLRRKASGDYYSLEDMHQMMLTKWAPILSWVANESAGQWKTSELRELVAPNTIWTKIQELLSAKTESTEEKEIEKIKPQRKKKK